MADEISTKQAMNILKVSRTHVIRLINEGKLAARKIGSYYALERSSVEAYKREVQNRK